MSDNNCPICKGSSDNDMQGETITWTIKCKECGTYTLHDGLLFTIEDLDKTTTERQRKNASYFLRKQKNYTITEQNIHSILSIKTPSLQDRHQALLLALEQECTHMGEQIVISEEKYDLIESTWAFNYHEFMEFIIYLTSEGFIKKNNFNEEREEGYITITPKGWAQIEHIKNTNKDSLQGFVAMWFKESMTPIYDTAIAPAISLAGYKPHRVDRAEHAGKIDDEIIAQIRRSKFVVADFTGHRGGVYYEAGFAHGLGLPVIMTCQDKYMRKIHFDIRQYNCIKWNKDNLDKLQNDLQNRIEAILGRGPLIHDTE